MDDKIICKKVSSMLSVYIDNKISDCERAFIEEHLANCENCYKKYTYLKSLIKSLKDSYKRILELSIKKQKRKTFCIKEHEALFTCPLFCAALCRLSVLILYIRGNDSQVF